MTPGEAVAALLPIVGTGGISAILVAYLGYKQAARQGRRDPLGHVAVAASMYNLGCIKSADIELLANSISHHTAVQSRLCLVLEYHHHSAGKGDDFETWIAKREVRDLAAALKAERDRRAEH